MIRRPPRPPLFPCPAPSRPAAATEVGDGDRVELGRAVTHLLRDLLAAREVPERAHDGGAALRDDVRGPSLGPDRKSTRLNSSHSQISYAVFCLKKKKEEHHRCMLFHRILDRLAPVRRAPILTDLLGPIELLTSDLHMLICQHKRKACYQSRAYH